MAKLTVLIRKILVLLISSFVFITSLSFYNVAYAEDETIEVVEETTLDIEEENNNEETSLESEEEVLIVEEAVEENVEEAETTTENIETEEIINEEDAEETEEIITEEIINKEEIEETITEEDISETEIEEIIEQEVIAKNEVIYPAFEESKEINDLIITVRASEGVFPEGAWLSVNEVSNHEQTKVAEAINEVRNEEKNVAASFTFDIKVLDKDGNELQPTDENKVRISFAHKEVMNTNLDASVYHMEEINNDTGETEVVATELEIVDNPENTIVVETDGFSYYTVEFTYDNKQYVLDGGYSITLSQLLDYVGLTGEVTSWEISNPELFNIFLGDSYGAHFESTEYETIYYDDGDIPWIVSLQPFDTEEWLKVVIDGIEYTIIVTDDNTTNTVPASYTGTVATNIDDTNAVTGDSYYLNADKPDNVRQSQSTTSCTDFSAGLALSTIFIDSSKIGGAGNGQSSIGTYIPLSNDEAILAGLVRNGNKVSYDPRKAGAYAADPGVITELNGDLFAFVFPDAAILEDGSRADLKITYSNAKIAIDQRLQSLGATYEGEISLANGASFSYGGTDNRYLGTASGARNAPIGSTYSSYPIAWTHNQRTAAANAVTAVANSFGVTGGGPNTATTAHTMDATYQIVDKNGNPINGTFIFAMAGINLDRDPYRSGGNNFAKPLWYYNNLADGEKYHFFSESVIIDSGMLSDYIYVRPNSAIVEEHSSTGSSDKSHYYPEVILDENGKVRFIGNAYADGLSGNDNTYSSGFVLMADASNGLKITALGHGSYDGTMNTQCFSAKQIWYRYTSTTGPNGNIQTTSEGNYNGELNDTKDNGDPSLVLNPNTYVVPEGKTITYTLTPNEYYEISKLQYKNASGSMREIKYNGKPLSTMQPGQKVTFNDASGQRCTLEALEDGKFKLTVPYALHDEAFHVEWKRTVSEITVRKITVDNKEGTFSFKIKAKKEEDIVSYNPENIGSIWYTNKVDEETGVVTSEYNKEFIDDSICSNDADTLANIVKNITLLERVEVSGGNYLWKTDAKLSDLGITHGDDDYLFINFLNAASASIGDTLEFALDTGFSGVPERIYFYHPKTLVTPTTSYWNFDENEGQSSDPGWHTFTLNNDSNNDSEIKFNIESKYAYEIYEETQEGWELLEIDNAEGAMIADGYLSEGTVTTPVHTFLNRKLPDLTISKETLFDETGDFTFKIQLTEPAIPSEHFSISVTAEIVNGILTYKYNNDGQPRSVGERGILVPTGEFGYGIHKNLDEYFNNTLKGLNKYSGLTTTTVATQNNGTVQADSEAHMSFDDLEYSLNQNVNPDGTYNWPDESYTITYTFNAPGRTAQPYEMTTLPTDAQYDSENKTYTFTISAGQSFTFKDVPYGTAYRVIEVDSEGWRLLESNGTSGALYDDKNPIFKNEKLLSITVEKETDYDTGEEFEFRIKVYRETDDGNLYLDLSNTAELSLITPSNQTGFIGNMRNKSFALLPYINIFKPLTTIVESDNELIYGFKLKNGDSITIENIPNGYKYEIWEVDNNGDKVNVGDEFNVTSDSLYTWKLKSEMNPSGEMEKDDVTSKFNNEIQRGALEATKKIVDGSANDTFKFRVKFIKNSGPASQEATAPYVDNIGFKTEDLPTGATLVDNDTWQFTITTTNLEGNALFKNIPIGFEYKVWEVDENGNEIAVGESPKNNWKLMSQENESGTIIAIPSGKEAGNNAIFTNQEFVDLSVEKKVQGNFGDKEQYFKFLIHIENLDQGTILELDSSELVTSFSILANMDSAPNSTTKYTRREILNGSGGEGGNVRDDIPSMIYKDTPASTRLNYTWAYGEDLYEWDSGELVWIKNGAPMVEGEEPPEEAHCGIALQQIVNNTNGEANIYVYLQGGNKVKIKGIPAGVSYSVTEIDGNTDGYELTASVISGDAKTNDNTTSEKDVSLSDKALSDTWLKDNTELKFINTRTGAVPTEIRLKKVSYLTPLIIVIIGLFILLMKKYMRIEE